MCSDICSGSGSGSAVAKVIMIAPRTALMWFAAVNLSVYLLAICLPDGGSSEGGEVWKACDSEALDGEWGSEEYAEPSAARVEPPEGTVAATAAAAEVAVGSAEAASDGAAATTVAADDVTELAPERAAAKAAPSGGWQLWEPWSGGEAAEEEGGEAIEAAAADLALPLAADCADMQGLVRRALNVATQTGEERAAELLHKTLAECMLAAASAGDSVGLDAAEGDGYDSAEAVTGWSVFWVVWLTILAAAAAAVARALGKSSPQPIRLQLRGSTRALLPLALLVGLATLWAVFIRPPVEHGLVPAVELMVVRAEAFDTRIVASEGRAEFMRSEEAWLAEINSLSKRFRVEIDQMMDSATSPQPTLMLLFFSLTAAATYGVLVARVVQDILPAGVGQWLEPAACPTLQVGWLISIPAGCLVGWQGWVGYRVVSTALKLAAVMRGHVTALHSVGEELVAVAAARDRTLEVEATWTWREASVDLRRIVEQLEGRRWGIKLAGFHMDHQFDATFTSIMLKILLVAVGVVLPLLWSKKQLELKDQKRQRDVEQHERQVKEMVEEHSKTTGLLEDYVEQFMDELNAEELTGANSATLCPLCVECLSHIDRLRCRLQIESGVRGRTGNAVRGDISG